MKLKTILHSVALFFIERTVRCFFFDHFIVAVVGVQGIDAVHRDKISFAGGKDYPLSPQRTGLFSRGGSQVTECLFDGDEVLSANHTR